jgi:hypothetical protein
MAPLEVAVCTLALVLFTLQFGEEFKSTREALAVADAAVVIRWVEGLLGLGHGFQRERLNFTIETRADRL